ncbi:UDP-N-acetylglucosamine--N-acetylmuramyl-(pentapeptide) pyrophosphoryl-undecaprenol N-acetylglucosamine transferase [Wolbachia pipientis]|uniref:UDP-N-acetylglucosamine--N-acetylmuramyl-(pentapeptide) pyrophosphoryl-undecaprenol N-acetylglucosamine transferase n=1 Tax=Wolbachia pipientis TaxID=955 RepID=A0A1E7QKN8_WOLPI|nr:UDP-N-acetylglucosamine--N-acetylmuramyl-(pentapeptide) pyrophosphoryl-undecaprenol N-acetylglucosamine transferase [Wolbachia pipientis]OEY87013.1 UDP-N-acetylglucosamine--N-acetylmuramyl-(pentapeptide) pyrophosphoryl-undecaprenol N-acetylglucosamine transferase [Wolbachia pipientis]
MVDIILATGGTGGHIFPAINLAKALKIQNYSCILLSDKQIHGIENYVLPLCRPSTHKIKFYFMLLYSCIVALHYIKLLKPKLVIGFGSYATFPALCAASMLSIPVVLHEQNSVLGRANRFFFKKARLVATSFPITKYAQNYKCIFTGNFIDLQILKISAITDTTENFNILIIAGSQGADFFDDTISRVICTLPKKLLQKIKITQQCISINFNHIKSLYQHLKINFELSEFFDNMEQRLANAHLVISRAGATSIAEITLAKRPAIYIPIPTSKNNHQFYNAKHIENANAAILIEQNSETQHRLITVLIELLKDSKKLCIMSNNTEKTGIKNGIPEFLKILEPLLKTDAKN